MPPKAQPTHPGADRVPRGRLIAGACIALSAASHAATAQEFPVTPANSQIGYVVFALGLLPLHGSFEQFRGTVRLRNAQPLACDVDVTFQVASLRMDDAARRQQALEPDMLAVDRFPTMHFTGQCQPGTLSGTLTMHGVSRPLTLALHRTSTGLMATGTLRRQDYGIDGLPHLLGSQVKIRLTTPAPEIFRAALP
jgi:polyisoprenoid-binding protein YceI